LEQTSTKQQVQEWLAAIEVGRGIHHRNMTVFPLFRLTGRAEESPKERYRLLAEAVEQKEAMVEEVSEGGQVPFLGVKNRGGTPILIPEGEILVGAKQNRAVNLTVLVAAKKTFKLPVSCVEQGRWHYQSRRFRPAAFAHPKLRDLKMKSAQRMRRERGMAIADQGRVWQEVRENELAMAADSPTRDFMASFDAARDRIDGYRHKVRLPEGACGFIAAQNGRVVGLDLFDTPLTMKKLWRRMVDGYYLEASRMPRRTAPLPKAAAEKFLRDVSERLEEAESQPELGVEFEVTDDRLSGSALFYDGAVCHLSAFQSA